jgi:hypothetical protein
MECVICGDPADIDGHPLCRKCVDAPNEVEHLKAKIHRLKVALDDAISRPMGVVPDSAIEFYKA